MGKREERIEIYVSSYRIFLASSFHGNGNIIIGERSFMCKQQ